jgi:hypothetical protein
VEQLVSAWVLLSWRARIPAGAIIRRYSQMMKKSMKPRTQALTMLVTAAGTAVGVTACTPAVAACTVRHHYAIVIFQNGGAEVGKTFVTRFRLNVRYSPYYVQHYIMVTNIPLKPTQENRPSLVVKTYQVGHARSCQVDKIQAH